MIFFDILSTFAVTNHRNGGEKSWQHDLCISTATPPCEACQLEPTCVSAALLGRRTDGDDWYFERPNSESPTRDEENSQEKTWEKHYLVTWIFIQILIHNDPHSHVESCRFQKLKTMFLSWMTQQFICPNFLLVQIFLAWHM